MQEGLYLRLHHKKAFKYASLYIFIVFCAFLVSLPYAKAQDSGSPKISVGFPYFETGKRLLLDVYTLSDSTVKGVFSVNCYHYNTATDSIFVFGKRNRVLSMDKGTHKTQFPFGPNDSSSFVHATFFNILRKCGTVPAGSYKLFISFRSDAGFVYEHTLLLQADSALPANSHLSKGISKVLEPKQKAGFFGKAAGNTMRSVIPASKTLENNTARIGRLFRSGGLTSHIEQRDGKSYVHLYYDDWYVGCYELDAKASAAAQVEAKQLRLSSDISSAAATELGSYRSLFSQVRELAKSEKQDNELKGELALSGNWSNGQPEYSARDNNYYEVRGRAETELADIPVSVEGLMGSRRMMRWQARATGRITGCGCTIPDWLVSQVSIH